MRADEYQENAEQEILKLNRNLSTKTVQHLTSIHAQIWRVVAKPGLIMHIDQIRSIYNVDVSVSVGYQLQHINYQN